MDPLSMIFLTAGSLVVCLCSFAIGYWFNDYKWIQRMNNIRRMWVFFGLILDEVETWRSYNKELSDIHSCPDPMLRKCYLDKARQLMGRNDEFIHRPENIKFLLAM
jgi:membrane protein DedA with SNARE-associated domain